MWLRLLIGIIVIYLLYRLIQGSRSRQGNLKNAPSAAGEDLVEDPVCHTYVPISRACRESLDGKTLYFCSPTCRERFKETAKEQKNHG